MMANRTSDTSSVNSDVDIADGIDPASNNLTLPSKEHKWNSTKVTSDNWDRRKSSVTMAKLEAIHQLENTIKMADIIDIKNGKITSLQAEVQSIKRELKRSRQDLVESKRINLELMERLQQVTDSNARQKIDLENLRTANMTNDVLEEPVNSDASYSRYLRDIIDNREKLMTENDHLSQTIDEQHREIEKLNSYIIQLEANHYGDLIDYRYIDETTVEDRTKSDLLKIIRILMDDKVVWMEYAIRLTHAAMAKCPAILGIDISSCHSELQCSDEEKMWAQLAIDVLKKVARGSPDVLRDIVQSQDNEHMTYLKSRLV